MLMEDMMLHEEDFYKAFKEVISKKDKVIVIYSGISNFIFDIKFKNKNIPKTLLDILEKIVTKNRTLILPAFSANVFLKKNKFDIKKSIDNIGILPKEALKRDYYRTIQPLHSYLVYGKEKKLVKKLKHHTSWGRTSILEFMKKKMQEFAHLAFLGIKDAHTYIDLKKCIWYHGDISNYLKDHYIKIKKKLDIVLKINLARH